MMTAIYDLILSVRAAVSRHQRIIGLVIGLSMAWMQLPSPLKASPNDLLEMLSTTELEERLVTIETELTKLADFTMPSGVGAIGYRSSISSPVADHWVQIDFKEPELIDQVVCVPSLARVAGKGALADAFPLEFNVIAGLSGDTTGTLLAHFSVEDHLLPRIAPVVIPFPPMRASWVRIEAVSLTPRLWDNVDSLQLSEVLIFSGQDNIALHQSVKAASSDDIMTDAYNRRYLVDGFVPYLMAANQGEQSIAFLSADEIGTNPTISIDLETVQILNQINLHSIEVSNKIPQSVPNDFATPRGIIVEGALQPDFSDAVQLVEYQLNSIYETGSIISRRFPETACRYIRLIATEPFSSHRSVQARTKIGFAEIELLNHGKNVARGKPASANFELESQARSFEAITDGRNFYGDILSLRTWMEQLALRHDLQTERPQVEAELKQRYTRQKTNFNRLLLSFAALLAGTVIMVLVDRMIRQRAIHRTREHIAADLHDELGANLHALGLLSDLTQKSKSSPDKLDKLLQRIRGLTERTGAAARYCTDMLEAKELYENVPDQMRRSSSRILQGFDHTLIFEGEEQLNKLSPRRRIDLCLFHKECLTNILRHSGATQVTTNLIANKKNVFLVITDNGQGLKITPEDNIPRSIMRRSRLLGSHLQVETPETGGTRITLRLNLRRWIIL